MSATQISTSVTIINSLLGFQAISLTNMATSAESAIAAGSKLEIASAFFTWASAEAASGWSAITTANTAYIAVTPSGSAGSQVASAAYTSTAPVWSESKQGWYASAGSITRYVGGVTKTATSSYEYPFILPTEQKTSVSLTGTAGAVMKYARYELGEWNMDTSGSYTLTSTVSNLRNKIVYGNAIIFDDTGNVAYNLEVGGYLQYNLNSSIGLNRKTGEIFDGSPFDGTASTVASRGYVNIWYIES